jgi:chromosome segregation ATPase
MKISKDAFTALERKKEKITQDTKHIKQKKKKLEASVSKEEANIAAKQLSLQQMQQEDERLAQEIADNTARQQKEEKKLEQLQAALKEKTSDIRATIEAKKQELIPKQKEATELEEQHRLASSELQMLTTAAQQSESDLQKYVPPERERERLRMRMRESVYVLTRLVVILSQSSRSIKLGDRNCCQCSMYKVTQRARHDSWLIPPSNVETTTQSQHQANPIACQRDSTLGGRDWPRRATDSSASRYNS